MNQSDRRDVRILVVDDDPEVLRVTARLLEKEGYAVNRAADGYEALRSVEDDHPALLLLDHNLPGIDGLEVCRRIKQDPALADIFVVIISGKKIEITDRVEGLRTGADDYIARPIDKRELLARVEANVRIVLLNRSLRLQAAELKKNVEAAVQANAASLNLMEDAIEARSQLETAIQELRKEIVERERAEKSLRLNTIALTAAANAIVITDRNGAVVWANPSFTTMTGYTLAETVGKNLRELVKSGQHERVFYQQMWETILAGGVWRGELVNRRKDGSLYPEEMTITPVRDSAEAITHFIAIKQDITVAKLADEAMRTNKARLSDAMKLAHLGGWELDVGGDRFTFDELFYEMLRTTADREGGYTMKSSRYLERFVHPDDRAMVGENIRHSAEVPELDYIREVQHRAIFGDGEIGYLAVRYHTLKDAQGRIAKIHGVNQDITKQHISFARIREQAEIINQAPVSIIITDLVGRITYCNPASVRIYGFKRPEEMINLLPEDIFNSAATGAFAIALATTIRTGSWIGEVSFLARDGRQVTTSDHMSLILDEAGKPKARLSIAVDVTEKKEFEEQALRMQRVENLGMLAAGIAHDFNNALAPIVLAGPLLRMQVKDPVGLHMLDIVDQSAARGAALVRRMLSFARGTAGNKALLDAGQIVREVLDLAMSTFPKSILVESHLANDLWPVMSDPTQFQQILLNLCVNARDSMPDGGKLTLTAANRTIDSTAVARIPDGHIGRFIEVEVRDTGTGIQPDVLERIWEPFFTTKGAGKGTGLGLSTVRSIIRQNDGFATVVTSTNAKNGHGTVFTFFLPAAVDGILGGDAGPKGNLPHGGRGELILLVDDETSVCEMGTSILTQNGYLAITASNGLEAITAFGLHASKVRLLLTDLDMPSLGGRELAIVIHRLRPDLPVIVMSGGIAQNNQSYREYATAFLPKPFTAEGLLSIVRQTLDKADAEVPPAASVIVET
jgi:PAS domain S-box-containing protein